MSNVRYQRKWLPWKQSRFICQTINTGVIFSAECATLILPEINKNLL
jgi:hypothetical protein